MDHFSLLFHNRIYTDVGAYTLSRRLSMQSKAQQLATLSGATENAGLENAGPLAMEHRSDKCSKTKIQFIST